MSGAFRAISICPPELRFEALTVLYRRVSRSVRDGLIANLLTEADAGRVDYSGLWVARRRGRVVGSLLTQPLAGRAVAVWSPEVEPCWGRAALAASLVREALEHYQIRGFRIAQALVDGSGPASGTTDLTRGGLKAITVLTYMKRDTQKPVEPKRADSLPVGFVWQPYAPETEALFRQTLQRTYEGSLDMPELDGIRSLDDVIASHKAAGRFDPSRWRVGSLPDETEAAGVLLLSEVVDRPAWEVAYLGLTPQARGRGLGLASLRYAIELARHHADWLELAVDDRNKPARKLYDAAGFTPFDRRTVHLAVLNRDPYGV